MSSPNIYTHCAACDTTLNPEQQPIDAWLSDLCGVCRKVVRKAVHYHEEDVLDLEVSKWRVQMGGDEEAYLQDDVEASYSGSRDQY